jgi:hypothetical protein
MLLTTAIVLAFIGIIVVVAEVVTEEVVAVVGALVVWDVIVVVGGALDKPCSVIYAIIPSMTATITTAETITFACELALACGGAAIPCCGTFIEPL